MNTIQKTIDIPANRHVQVDLSIPQDIPTGKAEMLVIISSVTDTTPTHSIKHLAGSLANSRTFAGDPVAIQKAMRNEW